MSNPSQTVGRPPSKRTRVLSHLRQEIAEGRFPPGSRLPTRIELEERFQASTETIQQVFNRLTHDGLVKSRGKLGTFVVPHPPHLCHYGLVFSAHPWVAGWRRLDTALRSVASNMDKFDASKMHFYYDITGRPETLVEQRRLLADVRAHRLAGVIFVTDPPNELVEALAAQSPPPVVAIMGRASIPGVTAVSLGEHFVTKAIEYLAGRGRRRVAFLNAWRHWPELARSWEDALRSIAAANGMTTEPHWMLTAHLASAGSVCNVIRLLFERGRNNRPDSLFVTDDNLVEHAGAGLAAEAVRVPEDVDVVAHCNFPLLPPSIVPVKRLGSDAREVLARCIDIIDGKRRGEVAPEQVYIQAKFDDEVSLQVEEISGS